MKNFVILGTQRTGSSALGEAIGCHPNIGCGWEWTQNENPLRMADTTHQSLINQDFSRLDENNRVHAESLKKKAPSWIGYRRLFRSTNKWLIAPQYSPVYQIERFKWHLDWFAKNKIHVIHIIRNDNLSWLKSKALSRETGLFYGKAYDDVSVKIDKKEALKRIKAKHWVDDNISSLKNRTPYIQVLYEDFLLDNQAIASQVVDFLSEDSSLLTNLSQTMKLKQQSTKSVSELVTNFYEIEALLTQNGLLEYFKEQE